MDFTFGDEQEALRSASRELLDTMAGPPAYRAAFDSEDGTDLQLWRTVTDLGWSGINIPESLGGLGLGLVELGILQEEAGRALMSTPFFSTVCLATPVVIQSGPGEAQDRFLRAVAGSSLRATLALTERSGRWDASGVQARAALSEGGWGLSGTKMFVPDAHVADEIIVVARTHRGRAPEEGISVFLVPRTALTTRPVPMPTVDGTRRLCEVSLTGVRVPPERLLGQPGEGWPLVQAALDRSAVALSAEAVGVASSALDLAVSFAKQRVQFGHPIGSFQAVSHRCADIYAANESARSATYYACWSMDEAMPDSPAAAATAKVAASEACRQATAGAIQIHGGIGFTWEHDAHLYYRRARFCESFLGDAATWRERVIALRLAS